MRHKFMSFLLVALLTLSTCLPVSAADTLVLSKPSYIKQWSGTDGEFIIPYSGYYQLTAAGSMGGTYGSIISNGSQVTTKVWLEQGDVIKYDTGRLDTEYYKSGDKLIVNGGVSTLIYRNSEQIIKAAGGTGAIAANSTVDNDTVQINYHKHTPYNQDVVYSYTNPGGCYIAAGHTHDKDGTCSREEIWRHECDSGCINNSYVEYRNDNCATKTCGGSMYYLDSHCYSDGCDWHSPMGMHECCVRRVKCSSCGNIARSQVAHGNSHNLPTTCSASVRYCSGHAAVKIDHSDNQILQSSNYNCDGAVNTWILGCGKDENTIESTQVTGTKARSVVLYNTDNVASSTTNVHYHQNERYNGASYVDAWTSPGGCYTVGSHVHNVLQTCVQNYEKTGTTTIDRGACTGRHYHGATVLGPNVTMTWHGSCRGCCHGNCGIETVDVYGWVYRCGNPINRWSVGCGYKDRQIVSNITQTTSSSSGGTVTTGSNAGQGYFIIQLCQQGSTYNGNALCSKIGYNNYLYNVVVNNGTVVYCKHGSL